MSRYCDNCGTEMEIHPDDGTFWHCPSCGNVYAIAPYDYDLDDEEEEEDLGYIYLA